MIGAAAVLLVSLGLAAPGAPASSSWIAPEEESRREGPFGVLFVPRYASAARAAVEGARDVEALRDALREADAAERRAAEARLRARLDAVQHWRAHFLEALARDDLPPGGRERTADALFRLSAEASSLEVQLTLLGPARPQVEAALELPGATAPPELPGAPEDRVRVGARVVIEADETVHEAVAFGDDVVVRGRVLSNAVAFGGDVRVVDDGEVLGDAVAFGGAAIVGPSARVGGAITALRTPVDALAPAARGGRREAPPSAGSSDRLRGLLASFLALGGASTLLLAVAPARVAGVATSVRRRPVRSALLGGFGVLVAVLAAALFAITLIGLPISLLLLGGLGFAGLLGATAVCRLVGERLPGARTGPPWVAVLAGAAACTALSQVPWVGGALVACAILVGLGGALGTRLGQP